MFGNVCLHAYLCAMHVPDVTKFGREHCIPWDYMGLRDGCELPYGFWELNPGPLEE